MMVPHSNPPPNPLSSLLPPTLCQAMSTPWRQTEPQDGQNLGPRGQATGRASPPTVELSVSEK